MMSTTSTIWGCSHQTLFFPQRISREQFLGDIGWRSERWTMRNSPNSSVFCRWNITLITPDKYQLFKCWGCWFSLLSQLAEAFFLEDGSSSMWLFSGEGRPLSGWVPVLVTRICSTRATPERQVCVFHCFYFESRVCHCVYVYGRYL